jgi:hypothetical protein
MNVCLNNRIFSKFCAASLAVVVLFFKVTVQAQDLELIKTKTIDGLYIGITGSKFSTNDTPTNDKLNFGIWRTATNNQAIVYIPTALEYIYQLELIDTNGVALPKTELGKKIGVKFLDLEPSFAIDNGFKLARERAMDEPSWGGRYLFFPTRAGYGGQATYSPEDLFEIKRSGNYMLRIHFQIIARTGLGQDETAHVVRFPALDYRLVKQ